MFVLSSMASQSRSLELLGGFRRGLGFVLLVVLIRWQGQLQTSTRILGISVNKVEISSFAAPVVLHAAGRSSSIFSVKFPWRKMREEEFGAGSLNKCGHLRFDALGVGIFLLAGHGGEEEEELFSVCIRSGRWEVNRAATVSSSTMFFCRPSIHAFGRQLTMPSWRLFNLQVRPFLDGLATAVFIDSAPSGSFPGSGRGGRRPFPSSNCGGEDKGPDCVSSFIFGVLSAKFQDQAVFFFFFEVLSVSCNSTDRY